MKLVFGSKILLSIKKMIFFLLKTKFNDHKCQRKNKECSFAKRIRDIAQKLVEAEPRVWGGKMQCIGCSTESALNTFLNKLWLSKATLDLSALRWILGRVKNREVFSSTKPIGMKCCHNSGLWSQDEYGFTQNTHVWSQPISWDDDQMSWDDKLVPSVAIFLCQNFWVWSIF